MKTLLSTYHEVEFIIMTLTLPFVSLTQSLVPVGLVLCILLVHAVVRQVHKLIVDILHSRRIPEKYTNCTELGKVQNYMNKHLCDKYYECY